MISHDISSILFVKTVDGRTMSDALTPRIRMAIKSKLSKRHIPAKIIQCPGEGFSRNPSEMAR